jgi:hypothetical protein
MEFGNIIDAVLVSIIGPLLLLPVKGLILKLTFISINVGKQTLDEMIGQTTEISLKSWITYWL